MRTLSIMAAACLLVGAGGGNEAVKKDMEKLEGEWSMVSGEISGQSMPEQYLKGSKRSAKDGVTTVTIAGTTFMKAKYTVNPLKNPKTIDYQMLEGFTKGKTQLGIYEIEGDTIKFCFAAVGADRPNDFSSKPGSGRTLSVWKRADKSR
jgi:uncharacterized protein (TIGR03067 family)